MTTISLRVQKPSFPLCSPVSPAGHRGYGMATPSAEQQAPGKPIFAYLASLTRASASLRNAYTCFSNSHCRQKRSSFWWKRRRTGSLMHARVSPRLYVMPSDGIENLPPPRGLATSSQRTPTSALVAAAAAMASSDKEGGGGAGGTGPSSTLSKRCATRPPPPRLDAARPAPRAHTLQHEPTQPTRYDHFLCRVWDVLIKRIAECGTCS